MVPEGTLRREPDQAPGDRSVGTWLARAVVASLVLALAEVVLVSSVAPEAAAPTLWLGALVVVAMTLLPTALLLAGGFCALERVRPLDGVPEPALSITVSVGIAVATGVIMAMHLFVFRTPLEFSAPIHLDMAGGVVAVLVAVALAGRFLLWPALGRWRGRVSVGRVVVGVWVIGGVFALLLVLHHGLASIHDRWVAPWVGPVCLVGLLWGVRVVVPRAPAKQIAGALALAVVLAAVSVVGPGRDPGVRFLVFSRAAVALPFLNVVRAVGDFDGDGASATWLGGTDCAPFDPSRGPFQREVPGDGVDQDCRGGDAPPTLGSVASSPLPGPWRSCTAALDGGPPNILLISVDALRADAVSPRLAPSMGPFATGSAWFVRAYAPSTHTFGSIPALFSGLGLSDLGRPSLYARGGVLDTPQTLLRSLAEVGYETAGLTLFKRSKAIASGFQLFGAGSLDPPPAAGPKADYSASALTDTAIRFVEREAAAPFFLWVHYLDVHAPYVPIDRDSFPEPDGTDYERAAAYTVLQASRLMHAVATSERAKDTVVVFTSDHGEDLGERGMHGHGPDLFEGSIHVPLGVSVPGCPGALVETPVSLIDLAPTLLALAGAGGGGWSLVEAADGVPRPLPVVSEVFMVDQMRRVVVDGTHTLLVDVRNGGAMLFDLAMDPAQEHDLYGIDAEATARMEGLYQRWLDRPLP